MSCGSTEVEKIRSIDCHFLGCFTFSKSFKIYEDIKYDLGCFNPIKKLDSLDHEIGPVKVKRKRLSQEFKPMPCLAGPKLYPYLVIKAYITILPPL